MAHTHDGERSMPKLIAVDPGLTTGVAMWDPEVEQRPTAVQYDVSGMHAFIHTTCMQGYDVYDIVCESFTISERTMKMTRQTWSLELIGALKYVSEIRGHTFTLQTPAAAKRFADNTRLRQIGWYVPGRDHANDALRHLFLYAVMKKIISL